MPDWSFFRGNPQQTGCSADPGPAQGRIAWKTPLGRQWYSPPLVEDGRVYQVIPGRTFEKVICLDAETGNTLWRVVGNSESTGEGIPARTRLTSRMVALPDSLLVRAARSDKIYRVAKKDGAVLGEISENGFLNYRVHPVPLLAGDSRAIVLPCGSEGFGNVKAPQPKGKPWNWMICKDAKTGEKKWIFRTGQYFSEPLVRYDQVFVGTYEGYLYCLNIIDPPQPLNPLAAPDEWEQVTPQRIRWSFKIDAPINSSPAMVGQRIFFGANDGHIYCLDAGSGNLIWKYRAGLGHHQAFIHFSQPEVQDGLLYIGSADHRLICLSAESGELCWEIETPDWVRARPAVTQNDLVVASLDGSLACYSTRGSPVETRWRIRLNHWHLTCDPVVVQGRVFVVTSDMVLWCLLLESGEILWKRVLVQYPLDWVAFDEFQSSPLVAGDRIFLGTPGRFVYAVDRRTGAPLWRFETGGEVPCDPICVDGRVYFGQEGGEGEYYCLDACTGEVLWKQRLGWVWSAANYAEGLIFVPGVDGNAYCLEALTGRIVWSYAADSDLYMAPALDNGLVYFGSWDHWLYALDIHTGRLVWKFHARTYLDSGAPAVCNHRLYLPTMGPHFYCLNSVTGEELWHFAPENIWSTNTSPAVDGRYVIMMAFMDKGVRAHPYEIWTYCLDCLTGELIWKYPAGGLNGPVIANKKVFFGSTERGKHRYICLDLEGNGDGTTNCAWSCPMDFTFLESCTAVVGTNAYIYAEDGYLYSFT